LEVSIFIQHGRRRRRRACRTMSGLSVPHSRNKEGNKDEEY
jgi:hypothetical protein